MIKILNLYAGIGGNRTLWGGDIMVTAVENNPKIAEIYQKFFPEDKVIVEDAHQYLLEHYKEFDFIWSSPPCPTHSIVNYYLNAEGIIRYPDMALYQEIIFLKHFFKGTYVVENVVGYYEPLIKAYKRERHYFWTNFPVPENYKRNKFNMINARKSTRSNVRASLTRIENLYKIKLPEGINQTLKSKVLRNCVNPLLGKYIFDCAFNTKQLQLNEVAKC